MDQIARGMDEKHARLRINHDKSSSDARLHAPTLYQ
jgi:hypothetical protein